jgi:hypothetical protein
MTEQDPDGGWHRVRLDRHGQLAGALLGFAVGMTVNLFTDDFGYPGLTAAVTAAAVLATASYVRRLPPQVPLARYATRLLLLAALPVLLLAAAGPTSWQPWAVAAAAALTITAVLIPTDPEETVSLLSGLAVIGVGVALAVNGVAELTGGHTLLGVARIGGGVALAASGVAVLTGSIALIGAAAIGGGVALAVSGVAVLTGGRTLFGVAMIGGGVAVAVGGVAMLTGSHTLLGVALIGGGVALAVSGVPVLTGGDTLLGVAVIGGGVAGAVCGVVHLHRGDTGDRVRAWWDRVTSDPAQLPGTTGPEPGESAGPVPD